MSTTPVATVWVAFDGHGGWEVTLPDRDELVCCATLDDARLVAYRRAVRRGQCELVVHDAYHRVISCELVGARHPAEQHPS
jgi:hypothetical protein